MSSKITGKKSFHPDLLANSFLFIGLVSLIFSGYLIFERYNPQRLSFDIAETSLNVNSKNLASPVGIEISSLNIKLPVTPAKITNNKWEATTKGVSYLESSVIPGEVGNSILYGHNWPNLLGNLKKIQTGDKISVFYSDHTVKYFLIEYKAEVSPEDTSVLGSSDDHRITLYTCSGFLDSKRLVVVAKLFKA